MKPSYYGKQFLVESACTKPREKAESDEVSEYLLTLLGSDYWTNKPR